MKEDCDCDRISELPDEVVCYIMCYLTVAEAFALKVQCRRWRRLEVPVTNIHINPYTMFGDHHHNHPTAHDFVEKVDCFLKSYSVPYHPITSLTVCFSLNNEFASAIDNWVRFAVSRMQAQSIELDFHNSSNSGENTTNEELYKFPFHLLIGNTSPKHLSLSSCFLLLPQSPFKFNSLRTLNLQYIFFDQHRLDALLSACSDLEWLRFKECRLPRTVRICSTRMKGLSIRFCWGHTLSIELTSLDQLQAFEYSGRTLKLSFKVVPSLQRVHVGFFNPLEAGTHYIFNRLPIDLPKIKILSLAWYTANAWPIPATVSRFSCLKQLDFFVSKYRGFDLLSITHVLNACPKLEKFHLHLKAYWGEVTYKQEVNVVYSKDTTYLHLEEIKVSGFTGTCDEMELVIYLLNTSVALQRMTLIYSQRKTHRRDFESPTKHFCDSLRKEMISHGAELIVR